MSLDHFCHERVSSRERVGPPHGEGGVFSRERVGSAHVRGWGLLT